MSHEKIKVIFLDVDGVINPASNYFEGITEEALKLLKTAVDDTDAKIVLTSTWRCFANTLTQVMDAFASVGLTLYGVTPDGVPFEKLKDTPWDGIMSQSDRNNVLNTDRGAEIAWWYWNKRDQIESFVIVDDEVTDILYYFPDRYVKIDHHTGLTSQDAVKIVRMLEEQHERKEL